MGAAGRGLLASPPQVTAGDTSQSWVRVDSRVRWQRGFGVLVTLSHRASVWLCGRSQSCVAWVSALRGKAPGDTGLLPDRSSVRVLLSVRANAFAHLGVRE